MMSSKMRPLGVCREHQKGPGREDSLSARPVAELASGHDRHAEYLICSLRSLRPIDSRNDTKYRVPERWSSLRVFAVEKLVVVASLT
jgi:hypothetical protein